MISWDLGILVLLKTFSMIRSRTRRWYYRAVFATYTSLGIEHTKQGKGKKEGSRRRKEWSQDVGRATCYKEFEEIEIYEPMVTTNNTNGSGDRVKKKKRLVSIVTKKPNSIHKSKSTAVMQSNTATTATATGGGLRRRHQLSTSAPQDDTTQFPPASPIKTIEESSPIEDGDTNGSPIRKIHSCLELKQGQQQSSSSTPSSSSKLTSPKVRGTTKSSSSRNKIIQRTYSSSSLSRYSNQDNDDNDVDQEEERWQNIVRDDLGMEGSMLLTTLARLKEARVQAASSGRKDYSADDNNCGNDDDDREQADEDNGIILPSLSSLSKDEEEEEDSDTEPKRSSYHITASFGSSTTSTSSKIPKQRRNKKQWNEDYSSSLKTLLSGIVKRNHLSIEDWLIQDARNVAERGQHSLKKETRDAIDRYGEEVERCMDWIANGPVYLGPKSSGGDDRNEEEDKKKKKTTTTTTPQDVMEKQREELSKRYTLVKRMKQNVGHTALMLSGGGAQTMYHLGSIKALVESGVYEHIHVISGTSGGSISAAMCAIKTPQQLLTDICVRTVSTDYMLTGEQKKKNVRWFPTAFDMGAYFFKNGIVVDGDEFKRCCDFYYGDITFEEAFEMTRKHVCITVTASRATSGKGMQRLLLNHISTPNVTLASAVRASCAVPGFFTAATLMIKDSRGKEVPFEVDGVEWIDGSVQADIPVKRISTLFNVSNYVVCQTNFHGAYIMYLLGLLLHCVFVSCFVTFAHASFLHMKHTVVPFIHKSHHPSINSLYWKL